MLRPFGGFRGQREGMNRPFVEFFDRRAETGWVPAMDVTAEDGDIVIRTELPGVRREDIHVTLSGGLLVISGERREEQEAKDAGYLLKERSFGSFWRAMIIPEGVNENAISARFESGVLEVRVRDGARTVEERPKRIEIGE
ncbi:MAG: Hsp20/alpha crystallin family protein, partial [Actinomycetota bacterium]